MKHNRKLKVLIIEDNRDIAENIADFLEKKGHLLDFAMDGIGGLHLAVTQDYDVIVLDIMLPGMDGLTLCRKLREENGNVTPILMLTARDTLDDKLCGFDAGTDDYLVKPFALQELEARLHSIVRRREDRQRADLKVGTLELDMKTMNVTRSGKEIDLSKTGIKILEILMRAHPGVVSRHDLEYALWGDMPPGSDALKSHMYGLRKAIDKPFSTPMLLTVHGIGFRLVAEDDIHA